MMLKKAIVSYGQNNKGMTLLEVMMTLAIFGIIAVTFMSYFTNMSIGITNSGKRMDATLEAKSILDQISIKIKENNDEEILEEILQVLSKYDGSNESFIKKNDYYEYEGSKINCFIKKDKMKIDELNSSVIVYEVKILNFYDNGRRKVELTTYVPSGVN